MSSILKRAFARACLGDIGDCLAPARAETYPDPIHHHHAAARGRHRPRRHRAALCRAIVAGFGKPVVVENKPGGAGLAGVAALKAAPADGYTMIVATSAVMAIRPTLLKSVPYDALKDFVPIALYVKSPFILVVNPALPIHSVPD